MSCRDKCHEHNIAKFSGSADAPAYKTAMSAGFDLAAAERVIIDPGQTRLVGTGLIIQPPPRHFTAIFARSSLHKRFLMLANGVGVVDPDYCGSGDEIKLALYNFSQYGVIVSVGERLAQGVFMPFLQAQFETFQPTDQSRGGFGSTGL